ncbi:MAG TPA: hypothetical protein VIH35_04475, partial [Kiritimatiellia bacterium]
ALAWIRKLFPDLVDAGAFNALKSRTLALQHAEGWFEEYGGADLGYLSVTIDCLWDLFDATQDRDYLASAEKALRFIAPFVPLASASIGMHNARNTDYILPYGIARFATDAGPARELAASMLNDLYSRVTSGGHFVHAIDDRYLCHYAGHSLLRCLQALRAASTDLPAPPLKATQELLLEGSGHYLRGPSLSSFTSILSLRKGGILSLWHDQNYASDFGWIVDDGEMLHVTHWQSGHWTWTHEGDVFTIRGRLVPTREHLSSPLKHMLLRAAVFVLGRRLIAGLKNRLIFQSGLSPYSFERRVEFGAGHVQIKDTITGLGAGARVIAAPRASKRHVSSADSHHHEDLALAHGVQVERKQDQSGNTFTAETTYRTV